MKSHNAMRDTEAEDAGWEATRGAVSGALRWGAVTAALGGAAYVFSPLYRGLTIQFKVYIQMSGMVFGSMIEADRRIRDFESRVRMQKRIARDRAMWQKFEDQYGPEEDDDRPPPKR